jgi:hypothetical protein
MLNVAHEYSLTKGTNFIDVSMTNSAGNPVEDVWVTIYKEGVVLESGYSDNSGFVRINVPTTQVGEVLVTATKKNHYPYKSSFQIYDPGPSVNVYSDYITVNDNGSGGSSGNGDGILNAGEIVELAVAVSNYGSEAANDISGVLTSENSNVTIINDTFSYGDLSTGDIVNNASSPFTFSVSDDVHHGAEVKLLLTLNNGAGYNSVGYIGLEVAGKSLSAYGVDVVGNSQDVLTSGQTSTVHIELFNSGSTTALDISGQITSASPAIEILDNNGILVICVSRWI